MDRSGDGRGRGTRSTCADAWLCLHCRGTQQRRQFYEFTSDFRLFLQVLYLILMDSSGQCWLGAEPGGAGDGSLSPCARGRAREGDAWQAGLVAAPAPAAPGVEEEEEEEAVLETGPLDTTTHTHTQNGSMAR